jgi:CubicO group peptidase (beta-lactamase class C family)
VHPGVVNLLAALGVLATTAAAAPLIRQQPVVQDLTATRDTAVLCDAALDSVRASVPGLMAEARLPGLAVAVIDATGRMLWEEGFGVLRRSEPAAVTAGTLFSIQSISKALTATAVMTGVRDGLVDLDTPISRYLPELRVQSPFEEHPENRITLRLLLSHHAGFTHEAPVGNNYDVVEPSFTEHAASIERTWLRFPVGQRFSYSNLGIDLAGRILEAVSGQPFPEYVRQQVLEPLGMRHSTFDPAAILAAGDRAVGHRTGFAVIPVVTPMMPSGGAYVSAPDLARFALFHLNAGATAGAQLIPAELLRQMHRIHQPLPHQTRGYGLGMDVRNEGRLILNHGGAGFGFNAMLTIDVDRGVAAVVLTNSQNHDLHVRLTGAILGALAKERGVKSGPAAAVANREPARVMAPASAAAHDSTLAGTYLYNSGSIMYVHWHDGRLGAGTVENFHAFEFVAPDEARVEIAGGIFHYRFVRSPAGGPGQLVRLDDGTWLDFLPGTGPAAGRHVGRLPPPSHWHELTGSWRQRQWGRVVRPFTLEIRDGVMHLGYLPLREHLPGLFFAPHGEVLDARGEVLTWCSIPLERPGPVQGD